MEKIQLTLLFKIIGIGSASGLVYTDERLYVISDNSSYLYQYDIPTKKLHKIALFENAQENIIKKEKPDFESITKDDYNLVVLGSGSTEKRNRLITYDILTGQTLETDFTPMFQKMKSALHISDEQFNIEGLVRNENHLYFFQRGNGAESKNGIIHGIEGTGKANFTFFPFELPKIKSVESTFTDAVLVGNKMYFLATAEDTQSTYLDGEVLGSLIGCIDMATMEVEFTQQISDRHKFEGLTLYKKSNDQIEFLLCEDNDTDALKSGIYSLKLKN